MRAPGRVAGAPRRVAPAAKVALPFYQSVEWKALMAQLLRERGKRCEDCGREGCRVYGDHIVEIKDGGAKLDKRNVRLRCGSCHGRKTAAERRRRAGLEAGGRSGSTSPG